MSTSLSPFDKNPDSETKSQFDIEDESEVTLELYDSDLIPQQSDSSSSVFLQIPLTSPPPSLKSPEVVSAFSPSSQSSSTSTSSTSSLTSSRFSSSSTSSPFSTSCLSSSSFSSSSSSLSLSTLAFVSSVSEQGRFTKKEQKRREREWQESEGKIAMRKAELMELTVGNVKKRGKGKGVGKAKTNYRKEEKEAENQARREVMSEYTRKLALDKAEGRNHSSVYTAEEMMVALDGGNGRGGVGILKEGERGREGREGYGSGEDGNCPICQSALKPLDLITALNCSHRFHATCVRPDSDGKTICPVCFKEFFL